MRFLDVEKEKGPSSGSGSMGALVDEVWLLLPIVRFWMVNDGTIDNHGIKGEKKCVKNNIIFPNTTTKCGCNSLIPIH